MKRALVLLVLLALSPAGAAELGFLAVGDTGTGDRAQTGVADAMATLCRTERCEHVVLLGDNFYPAGVRSVDDPQWQSKFEVPYRALDLPFFVSLGNHDYDGNVQAQLDYMNKSPRWRLPARHYYFTRGDAEFFAIDTNRFDEEQARWLEARLAASTAPWRFVFGHHPVYSYGSHGDTGDLVQRLEPILRTRADFYLAGHDHDLQLLRREGRTAYVLAGGGGAAPRSFRSGPKPRRLFGAVRNGFSHFQVTPTKVRLRFFYNDGTLAHTEDYAK